MFEGIGGVCGSVYIWPYAKGLSLNEPKTQSQNAGMNVRNVNETTDG